MPSEQSNPAAWPFVHAVLSLFSEHDMTAWLSWRCDGEYAPVSFYINCNDLFWWATVR